MSADHILQLAKKLQAQYGSKAVLAADYGIKPGTQTVYHSADLPSSKNRSVNLNIATEFGLNADPPFEWQLEISFYDPDSHYLLLADGRFVRAVRRDFFDVPESELAKIESELQGYLG